MMVDLMMQRKSGEFVAKKAIPAGYKMTEVGVIPEDWDVVSVSSLISSIGSGVSVNSVDKINAFSHGMHVLKTSCVSEGGFLPDEKKSILPSDIHRAKCSPSKGDIIVSRMNTPMLVGELGYVPVDIEDSFLPDRLWLMKFKNSGDVDSRWLSWLLSSFTFTKKIKESATGTSGSMKNISKETFLAMLVPKPVFKEQEIIATTLADTDSLIAGLEQFVAKKQAIKTATMQQLLSGRTRLPQFALRLDGTPKGHKTSELGQIPEDWEVAPIGSVLSITTGSRNTQDRVDDGRYPFFVHSQTVERINIYSFDGEAVLTAGDGVGTGKVFHYINGKFDFHQRVYLMYNFGERVSGYFFYLFFSNNFFDRIMSMTAKSSVDSVRREMIADMKMVLPSKAEQTAIATILSDMRNELQVLTQKLEKARALKQGMMQQLLTGKTRLIKPLKEAVHE